MGPTNVLDVDTPICIYPIVDSTFAALSDGSRRRIVELLVEGERSVNDLVGELDIAQSGVSRHLKILRDAGFVTVRAEGQRRLYALRAEPLRELDAWMDRYRAWWETRLDAMARQLAKKKREREEGKKAKR